MLNKNFIVPQYDSYCFANIPDTIKYLLTGQGQPSLPADVFGELPQQYDTVILFFIDSFGWRFFKKYRDRSPFLKRLSQKGKVSKLTSQFPSTTAAHVTSIHTGLPVGQSGVFEWQYYEPQLDAIIAPLLFSFAGTKKRDTLTHVDVAPHQLFPTQTIYKTLQQHGVTSYIFQHSEYALSTPSKTIFKGARNVPYTTLPEALVNLNHLLSHQKSPAYFFLYFDKVDAISHKYGPDSPQLDAEIDTLLTTLDRLFLQKLDGSLKNTLFMLTADHGQVSVNPESTIYLNLAPQFNGLQKYFKTNQKGELLVPAGSCRDMFLYINDDMLDEAQNFIAQGLAGKAEVHQVQHLINRGYFGPLPLSSAFLGRVGNLVILPYENESVWWYEKGKFEQNYYGYHGGLTPNEMEIPLALYSFSA